MVAQVNSAGVRLLRLVNLGFGWGLCAALLGLSWGCGGDDGGGVSTMPRDAQMEDASAAFDANGPRPVGPAIDAAAIIPGDPPPELEGQVCAVDTNKLYGLVTLDRPAAPTQLAADQVNSRFGMMYVGDSRECIDAVFLASVEGPANVGEPEIELVSDGCTSVQTTAVTHNGLRWLAAMVDGRQGTTDLSVQAYDGEHEFDVHRITSSAAPEREVAIAEVGDAVAVAWVEQDAMTSMSTLQIRLLSSDGEPTAESVVLEQSDVWTFSSLSLARIGTRFIGLAYRRFDGATSAEIVLEVLRADTAEREREGWILTSEAGAFGGVDLATDDEGGGVVYSLGQADSQQLWFQQLDRNGNAAPVMNGNLVGGPSVPERILGPPLKAVDASVAKLPVGFAVAYRALPSGTVSSPRIRVQFLDRLGSVVSSSDVALASEFGGRTAIESGYDGRIAIGWTDTDEDGKSTLTVIKLPCVGGA